MAKITSASGRGPASDSSEPSVPFVPHPTLSPNHCSILRRRLVIVVLAESRRMLSSSEQGQGSPAQVWVLRTQWGQERALDEEQETGTEEKVGDPSSSSSRGT